MEGIIRPPPFFRVILAVSAACAIKKLSLMLTDCDRVGERKMMASRTDTKLENEGGAQPHRIHGRQRGPKRRLQSRPPPQGATRYLAGPSPRAKVPTFPMTEVTSRPYRPASGAWGSKRAHFRTNLDDAILGNRDSCGRLQGRGAFC